MVNLVSLGVFGLVFGFVKELFVVVIVVLIVVFVFVVVIELFFLW